jgi:uncharacterized protein
MSAADASFLGAGWTFPPTFSRPGLTVVMAEGEEDVRQALRIIIETVPGERVMLPTFGCGIWTLVFRALTSTFITELAAAVQKAILDWEPRVDLEGVEVREVPDEEGLVTVTVSYRIRRTNTRDNLVFPFYVREGTLVPAAA